MADRYLYHASSAEASPYETPNSAAHLLSSINALTLAVNETIWVSSIHAEDQAVPLTFSSPTAATVASPQRLLCVSDFDVSPGTLSTGALIETDSNTAGAAITFSGNWYIHGIHFRAGIGINYERSIVFGSAAKATAISITNCEVTQNAYPGTQVSIGPRLAYNAEESNVIVDGLTIRFGTTLQKLYIGHATAVISRLALSGSIIPSTLLGMFASTPFNLLIENSDLTGLAWTYLINVSVATSGILRLRNCKLPSSFQGFHTGTWGSAGVEIYVDNCDSADTNYRMERHCYAGSLELTTAIKATTNPATDGTTEYSWKLSCDNASIFAPMYSEWIHVWVDSTSTPITPSVQILVSGDGATALTDAQVWLECDEMVTASTPLATRVRDRCSQVIDAGVAQAAGTTAWTGDGYTTERTHTLSVPQFTPTKKGYLRCRVALTTGTIYINPKIALT